MTPMMVGPDEGETELGPPVLESQPHEDLERSAAHHGRLGLDGVVTHETHMNGVTTNVDSIGVFGFMMLAEPLAVQMAQKDFIYVTSEPFNGAPVEIFTAYSWDRSINRTRVELAVWDWSIPDERQRCRTLHRDLFAPESQQFVQRHRHNLPVNIPGAPSGGVFGFWFKNYYAGGGNNVFFRNPANGNWVPIYKREGAPPPPRTPAGQRSGWSVLEYKRSVEYKFSDPWTRIRTPIGIANIHLLSRTGDKWSRPSGGQSSWLMDLNKYQRVWEEPIFSFAYRDWS